MSERRRRGNEKMKMNQENKKMEYLIDKYYQLQAILLG